MATSLLEASLLEAVTKIQVPLRKAFSKSEMLLALNAVTLLPSA